ncbi:MAG: alpha/beta fold hydrolase [Gammaproteobacteria bacterium]|nr:alpha/beta fold hydrolase [Gammaproteobacteria bacterium]
MRLILTIALLCVAAACEKTTPVADTLAPDYAQLGPCEPPDRPGLRNLFAESLCGTVTVFEDREAGAGRTIDLNVMVIRATSPAPRPDPVFFLAGGPGQAATTAGPPVFAALRQLRQERDVVLVDQRGTGKSNSLACRTNTEGLDALGTQLDELAQIQIERMKRCLAEYDADPALYSTPIAMDDVDEVRRELGFDRINLYGISYGTRAALVYLRRHESSVRSLIIDGVVPLTMAIPENVALDAQAAFDRMVGDCREQPACNAAFPRLEARICGTPPASGG